MQNGSTATLQTAESGIFRILARESGIGFFFGRRIGWFVAVTPKVRFSISLRSDFDLDLEGVKSFRPGVI